MKTISALSAQFVAAASAMALSLVLISGTVAVPAQASSSAYVGEVA
jgi:hypothetical protein